MTDLAEHLGCVRGVIAALGAGQPDHNGLSRRRDVAPGEADPNFSDARNYVDFGEVFSILPVPSKPISAKPSLRFANHQPADTSHNSKSGSIPNSCAA